MYADKDKNDTISLMEISKNDAQDLASCLFEFECKIDLNSWYPVREQARLALFSSKLRFLIIDALKLT